MSGPVVAESIEEARAALGGRGRVGLVPTMGALHAGHASLLDVARPRCDVLAASIFVNPTQFGPGEDLDRYPRTFDADRELCRARGVDVIFLPTPGMMYPPDFGTWVTVDGLPDALCGPRRPGHFRGVCTVVLKLFNITRPDVAAFGQKDYQQARIIQKMTAEFNLPIEVVIAPTVREPDGLALSSRNRYLSDEERSRAPVIHKALSEAARRAAAGESDADQLRRGMREAIEATPGAAIDYVDVVDAETLRPVSVVERPAVAAAAVYFGETRLIDNVNVCNHPGKDDNQ